MSDAPLFVILGAGSSYDASSLHADGMLTRPPLVRDLFDGRWHFILDRYPLAKHAAPDIRDAMMGSGSDAVSLEEFLRTRYRHSSDEYDKRRWYSILAYLQHLLWWVSLPDLRAPSAESRPAEFRYEPDRLSRVGNLLIDEWDHVCFITLNYDLILDRYLAELNRLVTIGDFISHPRWSLIKLHGSVTWKYKLSQSVNLSDIPPNIEDLLEQDRIFHDWSFEDDARYVVRDGNGTYPGFPALSAPLGEEDELVCPPEHVSFVQDKLRNADALNLLVIGYSAYDRAVLNLLAESKRPLRSLYVVSENAQIAQEVAERIGRHVDADVLASEFALGLHGDFASWVGGGTYRSYPEWVRGAA